MSKHFRSLFPVRTEQNTKNTTERTYAAVDKITYPQLFDNLASDQKRDAKQQLQFFPPALQQSILDEWLASCLNRDVRNPAAYLFGLIKKAHVDEFRVSETGK